MKTAKQIIQEGIQHIRWNGRAHDGVRGYYYRESDTGPQTCLVGMCLLDPVSAEQHFSNRGAALLRPSDFSPAYAGHSTEFWVEVQELHDCCDYWDGNRINNQGRRRALQIIHTYTQETD